MSQAEILTGESVRDAAAIYFGWGVNVTAIDREALAQGVKKPGHAWKRYQTIRQTPDEADCLPWRKAGGVGAVHGIGNWRCYDLDKCNTFGPVARILDELSLPHTYPWLVRTGGGWHIWIRCAEPLPTDLLAEGSERGVRIGHPRSGFDFDHLELRWESHQTLLPPSMHPTGRRYTWYNRVPEGPPTVVPIERVERAALAVCRPPTRISAPLSEPEAELPAAHGGERTADAGALIRRAVRLARCEVTTRKGESLAGRNEAGFWLACQLRDSRFDKTEAKVLGRPYVDEVAADKRTAASGRAEPYTADEYDRSVEQAYSEPPRKPLAPKWGSPDAPPEDEAASPLLLNVRPLPDWLAEAATRPTPRRLFGDCWFEGELSILFAETNVGKSILAVQIADGITRGNPPMEGFPVEGSGRPVLYLDFELSAKQFHGRYSEDYGQPHAFAEGFLRAEVDTDFDFEGEWAPLVNDAIEATILKHDVRVVIVDNITYLRDETERAKGALPLMRHLNALKKRHGLSILALAHTPKRDATNPIGRNDLAGSRRLLDFCDSCFALGESNRDEGKRYLKQVKVRQAEFTLDGGNVALLSLAKRDGFLRFDLDGYTPEAEHLRSRKKGEDDELDAAIVEAVRTEPELSHREITRRLNTNHRRVGRVLERSDVGQGGTPGTPVPPVPACPTVPGISTAPHRSPTIEDGGDGAPGTPPAAAWEAEDLFDNATNAPF